MATAETTAQRVDPGLLANNYMFVKGLQTVLASADSNHRTIVTALARVVNDECWRHWLTMEGREFRWNAADFRRFLESPRPSGCQSSIPFIRKIIAGSAIAERFEELVRGEPGQPDASSQPRTEGGRFTDRNRNIIPVTADSPPTLPLSPTTAPTRPRDYSRESKQGTSVSYALRRLSKQRPDLLERVKAGSMSAHSAMVAAGFRPKAITIPDDPKGAARRLSLHFKGERLDELIAELEALERRSYSSTT